jgi:uncharacterized phage protein (TIGR02220 family)
MSLDQAEKISISKDDELELLRDFWVYVSTHDRQYVLAIVDSGDAAKRIIDYLNEKCGKSFRPVAANMKMIKARLKEFSEDDLLKMITHKCNEWMFTDMEKYLRPATLFNATKAAQYVGEIEDDSATGF